MAIWFSIISFSELIFWCSMVTPWVSVLLFCSSWVAYTNKDGNPHFDNSHEKMGLIMFIMASAQVFGGVFRPHVPEEGQGKSVVRKSWEVGHRVLGVTLLACGFWQMREGIALFAIKYSVSESGEGSLGIAYWVWIGIMTALIVLGGGYFKSKNINAANDWK